MAEHPYRMTFAVDPDSSIEEELIDFPVLLQVRDERLKGAAHGGRVTGRAADELLVTDLDGALLPHWIEAHDPATGLVRAWVRIPRLGPGTRVGCYLCGGAEEGQALDAEAFWGTDCRVASGSGWMGGDLELNEALTVDAWVYSEESRAEAMQTIAARWSWRAELGALATYDAAETGGLRTAGFFGAVFDGRYVYFVPQYDGQQRHGKVLRYDSRGEFAAASSWAAYDAGQTSGMATRGYYGAVFDGRYLYFVPRHDGEDHHSRVLRYDTRGAFTTASSWEAHDAGLGISYQSAAFDGRFIYFAPGYRGEGKAAPQGAVAGTESDPPGPSGRVLRYDTQGDFHVPQSYLTYDASRTGGLEARCYDGAVFDGRHIYFAPLDEGGVVLRYNVQGAFQDQQSWQAIQPEGMRSCVGAVFDGRYLYFVPYAHSQVLRFDTEAEFASPAGWEAHEADPTSGLKTRGYDGAAFDGRYVYFVPFWEGEDVSRGFHARLLRYDTGLPFDAPAAWTALDAAPNPGGFNGGAFDGRYLYCAPWRQGTGKDGSMLAHGQVLRCDTAGAAACFALKYMECGHNGGLCAAVPGPTLVVNAQRGVVNVQAHRQPGVGWHHLAGVYDGRQGTLYLDGELVGQTVGAGPLTGGRGEIAIGGFAGELARFRGKIALVRIAAAARSAAWIRAACRNLQAPERFVRAEAGKG